MDLINFAVKTTTEDGLWSYPLSTYSNYVYFARHNGAHSEALLHMRIAEDSWVVYHSPDSLFGHQSDWPLDAPARTLFVRTAAGTWSPAAQFGENGVRLFDFSPMNWVNWPGTGQDSLSWFVDTPDGRWFYVGGSKRVMAAHYYENNPDLDTGVRSFAWRSEHFVIDVASLRAAMPPYARQVSFTFTLSGWSSAVDSTFSLWQAVPQDTTPLPLSGTSTVYFVVGDALGGTNWAVGHTVRIPTDADITAYEDSHAYLQRLAWVVNALPFPLDTGRAVDEEHASYSVTMTYEEFMAADSLIFKLMVVPGTDGSGFVGANDPTGYPTDWHVAVGTQVAVIAHLDYVVFTI